MPADAKASLAGLFGAGGAAPDDEVDDEYADDDKASLYEAAIGKKPSPEQLEAFRSLVMACVGDE